jgi:hypothetical protein
MFGRMTMPPGVEPGEWFVLNITIVDGYMFFLINLLSINRSSRSGKSSVYSGAELQPMSQNITVLSVIDNDPPEILYLYVTPDPIDVNDDWAVSNTSTFVRVINHILQQNNVYLHVADVGVGLLSYATITMISPSGVVMPQYGVTQKNGELFHTLKLNPLIVTGTKEDAWMHGVFDFPRYSEGGVWQFESITVGDIRPNFRTYTFEQLGAAGIQNTFTSKN